MKTEVIREEKDQERKYRIKKLILDPGETIDVHWHEHRAETWCIINGSATVKVSEKKFEVEAGDTFVVPIETTHKITAHETGLIAIEIQLGEITEEYDIKRPPY